VELAEELRHLGRPRSLQYICRNDRLSVGVVVCNVLSNF